MTEDSDAADRGWFAGVDPGDSVAGAQAIGEGEAERPQPQREQASKPGDAGDDAHQHQRLHRRGPAVDHTDGPWPAH